MIPIPQPTESPYPGAKFMKQQNNIRCTSGFTLIEMLVVIAIIGFLAGIILPAVHKAREKARQADCSNNLRQFSIAITCYRDDHDGEFPDWLSNLYPDYIKATDLYTCISDPYNGAEGSKPPDADTEADMSYQFTETDDNDFCTQAEPNGRNADIHRCSYMYEFSSASCTWDDPTNSWKEVKIDQFLNGDDSHSGGYDPSFFPVIRCFYHSDERSIPEREWDEDLGEYTGEIIKSPLTLNVSYGGNVFASPLKWENIVVQ